MVRALNTIRTLFVTILATAILMAGCGSNSSSQIVAGGGNAVTIDPAALLVGITNSIQQPLSRALSGWEWGSFIRNFGTLLTSFK